LSNLFFRLTCRSVNILRYRTPVQAEK
jgi:hypothetical protein